MILESLVVPLLADIDKFQKDLERAENSSKTTAQNIGKNLSNIGGDMQKIGAVGTAGITAPLVILGKASIDTASDLQESMSKVEVVFGEAGESIIAWSQDSASAMGISQQNALEAAGTFGNLFSTMGLGKQETSDMSTGLVQLASDLASFNNLDPTEVLDKLRSGMVGETEPLRALGVNLSATAVQTKALEMGLGDASGALTDADLATARYALIMQQTTLAQGDFARTADGVANSSRINAAEFDNLKSGLGNALLPLMRELIPVITSIIQWFNALDPSTKKTIVVILGLVAAVFPLIGALGSVISTVGTVIGLFSAGGALATAGAFISGTVLPAIGTALGAIGLPVIALIAAIGVLVFVIKNFGDDALNTVKMVWEIIKYYFGQVADFLNNTFTNAWNGIKNAIQSVVDWVSRLIDKFKNIKIPDWLTPGSPTPFEMGLRGIGKAMQELNSKALPEFSSQLNIQGSIPETGSVRNNNPDFAELLQTVTGQKAFDEYKLAYAIRDAILQVVN